MDGSKGRHQREGRAGHRASTQPSALCWLSLSNGRLWWGGSLENFASYSKPARGQSPEQSNILFRAEKCT